MKRLTVCAAVVLLLNASPLRAGENPDGVIEKKLTDTTQYLKLIEFTVPRSAESSIDISYRTESGTEGSLLGWEENVTGGTSPDIAYTRRVRTEKTVTYQLYPLRAAAGKVTYRITIGKNLYTVKASEEIAALTAAPVPPPIPWDTFYSSKLTAWTQKAKQKAMRATVRVIGPASTGTGAIVKLPEWVDAVLRPGEELVVTAGHVLPGYLRTAEVGIDVFVYRDLTPVSYTRCKGRLVASTGVGQRDVACVAFTPERGCDFERGTLPDDKLWFRYGLEYFRVGCRAGNPPHFDATRPVAAYRREAGGEVSVDVGSEPGDSGGPLFNPDLTVTAICSGSNNKSESVLAGVGLLAAPKRPVQTVANTSVFVHSYHAVQILKEAEEKAREDARWATIVLPVINPKHGISKNAEQGLEDVLTALERAVETLPADEQEKVRAKVIDALDAYKKALKK